MSDEEIERFLALEPPKFSDPKAWEKYQVFFSVCAYTGCRMGEAAKLHATDGSVDFGRDAFVFFDTKTGDNRTVPIPEPIHNRLKNYVRGMEGYLFTGDDGVPVSSSGWYKAFKRRLRYLEIKRQGLCPYSLRHSKATRLVREGANLLTIMKQMGHKNPNITMQYTHLVTKDLEIQDKKFDPLIRKHVTPQDKLENFLELLDKFGFANDEDFYFKLSRSRNGIEVLVSIK